MNGPEHYREAEKHLDWADASGEKDPVAERAHLSYAQVHATLALAAATALQTTVQHVDVELDVTEWDKITGVH